MSRKLTFTPLTDASWKTLGTLAKESIKFDRECAEAYFKCSGALRGANRSAVEDSPGDHLMGDPMGPLVRRLAQGLTPNPS